MNSGGSWAASQPTITTLCAIHLIKVLVHPTLHFVFLGGEKFYLGGGGGGVQF